jgi:DNA-binding CsgD family transcriptional regulator
VVRSVIALGEKQRMLSAADGTIDVVTATVISPDMVGRVAELDELRSAHHVVADGQPLTVLLSGEAGVGKSRLVTEFAAEARDAGSRVVFTQCVELGSGGLPYAPVAGAVRELTEQIGEERLLDLAGPGREALAGLLPHLGNGSVDSSDGRGGLFEVVTVLLERVSAEQPLVLVIEDVHWADSSTRDLLRFMVRAVSSANLLLIFTYRSDDIHRQHPLRPFLAELDRLRNVRRIDVSRLSQREVGQQLAGIIGRVPAPDVIARVYKRSEGIPFFVEELACAEVENDCAPLPESLRDLLLVRVERLSDSAQATLRLIAVGGNRVDDAVLTEVSDLDTAALDSALREAVSTNLLRVDGEGYAFRHALLREVLHDDLLPGAHMRIHVRYAEVLEGRPELLSAGAPMAEIAHHWYAAHELERAFRASLAAADQAVRSYAHGDALQLLERALELWERVTDPVSASGADHAELLDRAAAVAYDAGELDHALALVEAASAEIDLAADPSRAAGIFHRRSKIMGDLAKPEAVAVAKRGLEMLPADAPAEARARLLQLLASQLMLEARFEEATEVAREAATTAHAAGAIEAESRAYNILGPSLVQIGQIDEGLAAFDTARQVAGDVPRLLVGYYINASDSLHLLGRYAEAARLAREGIDRAREIGLARTLGAMLAGNAASPLLALGDWQAADRLIHRALELDPPVRNVWQLLALQSWLQMWRDDLDGAAQSLQELRGRMARRNPGSQYAIPTATIAAEIALARNDPDTAWTEILAAFEERPIPGYNVALLAVAARTVAARARLSGSPRTADARRVRLLVVEVGDWGPAPVWREVVDAELAGDVGDDPAAWQAVIEAVEAAGGPVHVQAYATYRLGEVLAARGDREAAARALREAAERADSLGAVLLRRWIDELSRRARIPLLNKVAGGGEESGGWLGLTSREREVLRLVAAGRSNRQIGEELFITSKTASVHVSNILAKLGVSGRGEAAAIAHKAGLFDVDPARRPA